MTKKLEGKVAVLTGATSGMALATAKLLMQRPEAQLNHLSRSHVRRRVLGSERTLNERSRPEANLLAGAFLWRLSTAFEWLAGNRPPRLTRRVNVTLIVPSLLTIQRRPIE
jgi:NAD(P)-dependent dehydrogenase (short-subunit alcohol dehydrogenase family)